MRELVELDASEGGQVFRYGLGLAAILGVGVKITNIRKTAGNPGLQRQHLCSLQVLSTLCSAQVTGAEQNSLTVTFVPGPVRESRLAANIGTAGSISLLLQSILLPAARKKVTASITGGTDVPWSPSFYYTREVLFPVLKRFGCRFDLSLSMHGFFPKGGGRVSFSSRPAKFPLNPVYAVEPGALEHIAVFSQSAGMPPDVAATQARACVSSLRGLGVPITEHVSSVGHGVGSSIDAIAYFDSGIAMGVNAIGKKGVPATQTGQDAGNKLLSEISSAAPIDQFLADQLIPFMALAQGYSTIRVSQMTEHLAFAIQVAEKMCSVKFEVSGKMGGQSDLFVEGCGWKP